MPTEAPQPSPHASSHLEVPPPTPHAHSQPQMTPPSFDLSIDFSSTPTMHPTTSSYAPTSSNASALAMDPPHIESMIMIPTPSSYTGPHDHPPCPSPSSADPIEPLVVGSDTQQPATDVLDDDPPLQPSPPRGRPQRVRRPRTCGTGGRLCGQQGGCTHVDGPQDAAPPPPPPRRYQTRQKKRKFG